jgi:hypothetical protein
MILGAVPGAVAVGYFLLTGYLLNRVRPLPIATMPRQRVEQVNYDTPDRVVTPRRSLVAARS